MTKVILSSTTAGPGGASTVTTEVEVSSHAVESEIEAATIAALNATKIAAETWQAWSLENETPEQRELREVMESRQSQAKEDMRRMLEGA